MNAIQNYVDQMSVSHLIWDWNGTLLDDFHLSHRVICSLLNEYGLPAMNPQIHREAFQFPIQEFYRLLGFDFETNHSYHEVSQKYMNAFRAGVLNCQLFADVGSFLKTTQASGISHSILSAAPQADLHHQVRYYEIDHHFDHVYGLDNELGVSKIERGKQLLQESQIEPSKTLLIGDTDHDLEVGKALGVHVLLVAEGHQSFEKLSNAHPHVLKSRLSHQMI